MKNLVQKLAGLSALNFSDSEVEKFSSDFEEIINLIDSITDVPDYVSTQNISKSFSDLRSDIPEKSNFSINTKTVPRVI